WVRRVRGVTADVKSAAAMTAMPKLGEAVMGLQAGIGFDFLGAGNWLGREAIFSDEQLAWKYGATVMSRTEVLEISIPELRSNPVLRKTVTEYFPAFSSEDRPPEPPADKRVMEAAAKEISAGLVDATNLLVMDMDLCIRCGNCSLACHKVHG